MSDLTERLEKLALRLDDADDVQLLCGAGWRIDRLEGIGILWPYDEADGIDRRQDVEAGGSS